MADEIVYYCYTHIHQCLSIFVSVVQAISWEILIAHDLTGNHQQFPRFPVCLTHHSHVSIFESMAFHGIKSCTYVYVRCLCMWMWMGVICLCVFECR